MTQVVNDIANIVITAESSAVSRAGFSSLLVVPGTTHSVFAPRLMQFVGPDILGQLVDEGFTTSSEAYDMATAALAVDPQPADLWVGRVDAADADPTATMNAIAAATVGDFTGNEVFYTFAFGTRTAADIEELAAWSETQTHMFVAATADTAVRDGTGGNIAETLRDAGYRNTVLFYAGNGDYVECAMAARAVVADLDAVGGQITWANKTLTGITPTALTGGQRTIIHGYRCNTYERRMGKGITREGWVCQGEYADVQTTIHWLDARMTEDVFQIITSTPTKIDFDDDGIATIETGVRKRLDIAVGNKHLAVGPTLRVPTMAEVLASDFSARTLRNLVFSARARGAIHTVSVRGRISV